MRYKKGEGKNPLNVYFCLIYIQTPAQTTTMMTSSSNQRPVLLRNVFSLDDGTGVGVGVTTGVGTGVGVGVTTGAGTEVGTGVGTGVGAAVGHGLVSLLYQLG